MSKQHDAASYAKGYEDGAELTRKQLEAEIERRVRAAYLKGQADANAEFAGLLAEVTFTVPVGTVNAHALSA